MTSPSDLTTAQKMLRRVEGLLPELAEVTLDFGQYPIPDIPYLTIVKWALSSDQDWPLLAEKRGDQTNSATFGLTDELLRRVIFDDLKRSLWRPPPDGLTVTWDDQQLRLTLSWSPRELPPEAEPIFARLASTLDTSTANLVNAEPESTMALRRAIAEARGPARSPKPAFRVDVGHLNLPPERYPGETNEERARLVYAKLKQRATPNDPRIAFFDNTLTVEFDDHVMVMHRGLRNYLAELARLPQFMSPPTHPGAPHTGLRQFPSARGGADLRAIEHAFAVPGYRAHRQARRRALTTGLTYDAIAHIYRAYEPTFTAQGLTELDLALRVAAAPGGDHHKAFVDLFRYGGLVIGEYHTEPNAFQFAQEHMPEMKKAGMTRFICETFDQEYQEEIDTFLFGNKNTMDSGLQDYVRILDEKRDSTGSVRHNAVKHFLAEARRNGIPVIAAEHPAAFYAMGAGRIADEDGAWQYDHEKRLARFNAAAVPQRETPDSTNATPTVDVYITGENHVNTTNFGYPGIAQCTRFPGVKIERSNRGRLCMSLRPENRANCRTEIPTHPRASSGDPSSSSVLRLSPTAHDLYAPQAPPQPGGIPI